MERLTYRNSQGWAFLRRNYFSWQDAVAKKLAHYEDLEEQGYKMVNINKIIEQLEDVSCYIEDGDGHAGHLVFTDEAIEIVKGGAIWED
jgi:hypothetical protein